MARKKHWAAKQRQKKERKARKERARSRNRQRASPKRRATNLVAPDRFDSVEAPALASEETGDRTHPELRGQELFAHLLQLAQAEVKPDALLESHPIVKDILSKSSRLETAAIFGAMLLDERLQSNCTRLEALVHLAVAQGNGSKLATQKQLADCFNELGDGVCGRMEDPAEDVFVSLVTTSEGNFRILEGVWESGTFFLQQVLDIVESFPKEEFFSMLRARVIALLKLSEAVCERAGLARYAVGAANPKSKITQEFFSKANRKIVFFDCNDLEHMGLTKEALDVFTFDDEVLSNVLTTQVIDSPLQRFPILDGDNRIALVLPTAVSFAIRAVVIDFLLANGFGESLQVNLARQYAALFGSTQLLGSFRNTPIFFSKNKELPIAEAVTEFDSGRYFHFLFFTDTLNQFYETGLAGANPVPAQHIELIKDRICAAIDYAKSRPGYRGGLTLLVHCGLGRGLVLPIPEVGHKDWDMQFISAPDLLILSCTSKFTALKLWRTLEGAKRLVEQGVQLHNNNGLLNLIAWIDTNEGHLVSHSQVPKGFRDGRGVLFLAPNFVRDVRHSVANENDIHGVRTVDGRIELVRRLKDSVFPEDNEVPMYAVDHFLSETGLPIVYISGRRSWWCHVIPSAERVDDYDRWLMLRTWLPRIATAIEPVLDNGLRDTVLLRVEFQRNENDSNGRPTPTRHEIEQSCTVVVEAERATITANVGEQFDLGLSHTTNVSERVLVMTICRGFAELANVELTEAQSKELELQIVESDGARQMHAFHARTYRDLIHEDLGDDLIRLNDRDVADLRNGLAFRVESRETGRSTLRSKRQCTQLLNAIVRDLEDELCQELQQFDRAAFIELCLRNHEKANIERNRWMRTARANIAIHRDKESALNVISEYDLELNAVLFPSRVLIEFAVCECPTSGGARAGHLDFSRLMAKANAIWELGGWSDAIHLDAAPPSLTITALGDVQRNQEFESNVLMPFSKKGSHVRIDSAVEDYAENFRSADVRDASEVVLEPEFENAWMSEFEFAVNDLRKFVDRIEDIGITRKVAAYRVNKNELVSLLQPEFEQEQVQRILKALSLPPRDSWRTVPEGFHEKDIQPWRFRRQLSAVRRPIVQLDSSDDPELIVAPGIVRECVVYVLHGYYEGSFPDWQFRSRAMRRWYGKRANDRGSKFAELVAERIRELGWNVAKTEMEVKEILGCRNDPDYGDVSRFGDVDVLAWNEVAKRILVIECKHLHFHKTTGEIAEQLSDYRGRTKSNGKPDDLLKHLNRLEILNARHKVLCKTIGVDNSMTIEGWILFKNPVPMLYSWKEFEKRTQIATFDDVQSVLGEA